MKIDCNRIIRGTVLAFLTSLASGCGAPDTGGLADEGTSDRSCFSSSPAYDKFVAEASSRRRHEASRLGPRAVSCTAVHKEVLGLVRQLLNELRGADAKEFLIAIESSDQGVDSERLYLLYSIAKFDKDRSEMSRISRLISSTGYSGPYASLVKGVEACLQDNCGSAVQDLELASAETEDIMAKGYLAAAYAYSGDLAAAETAIDNIAVNIVDVDEFVFYVGVATYLKQGRRADAHELAERYLEKNEARLGDSPIIDEARRLLSEFP